MSDLVTVNITIYQEVISYTSDLVEEYHGWALPGTATSEAKWLIKKNTYDANILITKVEWALKGRFAATWDDRVTEDYT